MRTVLLTDDFDRRAPALLAALRTDWAEIELHVVCPDPVRAAHPRGAAPSLPEPSLPKRWAIALSRLLARLPFHCAVQLVAYSPDLVIAEDFGARTLQAALYRSLSRRSRLLLCAIEPPPRFGLIERLVLSQVDGILAEGESMVRAVEQLDIPSSRVFPISTPGDFETFLACPRVRPGPAAHRLACVGDLSPHSGAVDLLIGLAAWADRHPDRQAEIWWLGEGDLAGVLEAQPLPDNMTQRFLGTLNPANAAAIFAQCGFLAVPCFGDDRAAPIAEALAAGLIVLGSRRSRKVRQLVRDGVTGWTFDPMRAEEIVHALDRALGSSAEELDRMRDGARALVRPLAAQGFAERVRRAVEAVLPDPAFTPGAAADAL